MHKQGLLPLNWRQVIYNKERKWDKLLGLPEDVALYEKTYKRLLNSSSTSESDSFQKVAFEDIAGLEEQKYYLREVVRFPLLYKEEIYGTFNVKAPKGVLFHGPPGTGKTLMGKYSFFVCAGAGYRLLTNHPTSPISPRPCICRSR